MRIIIAEAGVEYRVAKDRKVQTPLEAYEQAKEIAGGEKEVFAVLYLNSRNGLIAAEVISVGVLDGALVHPREVFRPAIARNASVIIVAHNHPSGDLTPSAEDLRVTRQLVHAGQIIGIKVMDHVIIGDGRNKFLSLRESGMVSFDN